MKQTIELTKRVHLIFHLCVDYSVCRLSNHEYVNFSWFNKRHYVMSRARTYIRTPQTILWFACPNQCNFKGRNICWWELENSVVKEFPNKLRTILLCRPLTVPRFFFLSNNVNTILHGLTIGGYIHIRAMWHYLIIGKALRISNIFSYFQLNADGKKHCFYFIVDVAHHQIVYGTDFIRHLVD